MNPLLQNKIIDSRDVIEYFENLEEGLEELIERRESLSDEWTSLLEDRDDIEDGDDGPESQAMLDKIQTAIEAKEEALEEIDEEIDDYKEDEYNALKVFVEEASGAPDWHHGETLIPEDEFTDYIEELINSCYEMPSEINSGKWPYNHMSVDYEAAADEAKSDYMEVEYQGLTYLLRA